MRLVQFNHALFS